MGSARCIYCGRFFNPARGKGDHILPSALFGEFAGDVRFRGACPRCNNSFSPLEQILAQATPLGYLRAVVNPQGRPRQSSLRQRGARGSKPPRSIVWASSHGEVVEPLDEDPRNVRPVDRITLLDENGGEHYVRLYRGMRRDRLRADMAKAGCQNPASVVCECDTSNDAMYRKLLTEVLPDFRWEDRPDPTVGERRVRGRVSFTFST